MFTFVFVLYSNLKQTFLPLPLLIFLDTHKCPVFPFHSAFLFFPPSDQTVFLEKGPCIVCFFSSWNIRYPRQRDLYRAYLRHYWTSKIPTPWNLKTSPLLSVFPCAFFEEASCTSLLKRTLLFILKPVPSFCVLSNILVCVKMSPGYQRTSVCASFIQPFYLCLSIRFSVFSLSSCALWSNTNSFSMFAQENLLLYIIHFILLLLLLDCSVWPKSFLGWNKLLYFGIHWPISYNRWVSVFFPRLLDMSSLTLEPGFVYYCRGEAEFQPA